MPRDDERAAELAYQDAVMEGAEEAHALEWPNGCDAWCQSCERRMIARCDDGHEWPADYTSGDTCWCGAFYLTQLSDGRMKLTEPQTDAAQERGTTEMTKGKAK